MRMDSIISELVRTSRGKAAEIIKQERVQINHITEVKLSKNLNIGDLITIRGKGRFKISEIENYTKKGNVILKIEKYI